MTAELHSPRGRVFVAMAILAVSLAISFALYVETMTPPSRPIDLLVHLVFFPLIYPIAPLFLDSAFGLGSAAYATYPGIALTIVLIVGSRAPVGLAAAALLTVYMLSWTTTPVATMGYQSGQLAAFLLGAGILGQLLAVALPMLAIAALIVPRRSAGAYCLFAGAMAGAALVASAILSAGFGGLTAGGYIAIAAACAAAVIAIVHMPGRNSG